MVCMSAFSARAAQQAARHIGGTPKPTLDLLCLCRYMCTKKHVERERERETLCVCVCVCVCIGGTPKPTLDLLCLCRYVHLCVCMYWLGPAVRVQACVQQKNHVERERETVCVCVCVYWWNAETYLGPAVLMQVCTCVYKIACTCICDICIYSVCVCMYVRIGGTPKPTLDLLCLCRYVHVYVCRYVHVCICMNWLGPAVCMHACTCVCM
jgi:hypothetical protein